MTKDDALKKLKAYADAGCHLLIPTTQHLDSLSDQFAVIIETVKLSGHPKDRDVYPHDNGTYDYQTNNWKKTDPKIISGEKVRITKQGLNKLNILSGIIWSPTLCREIRDPDNSGRIAYEAVGGVRKPDGTPYFIPKIYAMDIDVEREKLVSLHKDKKNSDYLVNRDLLQKKGNIATLCESGAKNRVTREVLCLKNFYTVAELEKEFVMARIVPKLDLNDAYTRQRLVDLQLAAMTGIFGGGEPPRRMIEHAAPIDINMVNESQKDDEPPENEHPENAPEQNIESQVTDFTNSDVSDQVKTLDSMAKKINYDIASFLKSAKKDSLTALKPETRIRLFRHLLTLQPNVQQGPSF
jgi:hypothetical protein